MGVTGIARGVVAIGVLALAVAAGVGEPGGVRVQHMMAGTPYETELFVLESAEAGPDLLVLAGVHGNEPATWQAAESLLRRGPPTRGRLLIIPRANRLATHALVRSTPEMGDLNRLYFGDPELFPMARMANEIIEVARSYEVDAVLDLHESWSMHQANAGPVDVSALGQTISPHRSEPSLSMAEQLVRVANAHLPWGEGFHYHVFPPGHRDPLITPLPPGVPVNAVPRKSGMDIPEALPEVASILVEVGQQQRMDRRVAQLSTVTRALLALLGNE